MGVALGGMAWCTMSDPMSRRSFLSTGWKVGAGLIAIAGLVTTWDFIRPRASAGFAAIVSTIAPEAVGDGVVPVPEAKGYLVAVDDEVIALSEVCTHLSCRVPWVAENNRFECPCHGSKFMKDGTYIEGPAPRGMDQYATEVVDGVIEIDTTDVIQGEPA